MLFKSIFLSVVMATLYFVCMSQTIKGEVIDKEDRQPVAGVVIKNVYTSLSVSTSESGSFLIAAANDELLEFDKPGYKTTRVRIPKGYIPSYFMIVIQKGVPELKDINAPRSNRYDYRYDSARFHELYKHELDFPKLSGIDMIAHPFSALSTKNREIWRFQDEYAEFEKEKYVDRTFNEGLINKFTGLSGDSLRTYMRLYRPSYEQLRVMNDYNFYNFIKTSVNTFRERPRGRNSQ